MAKIHMLPVIFRKSAGEVTAIFPTEPCNNRGDVSVYTRVGQHGGASWSGYRSTRKATPDEFAPLFRELRETYEEVGVCLLQIVDRVTPAHRRQFSAAMQRRWP